MNTRSSSTVVLLAVLSAFALMPLSAATPILLGGRAAELKLIPPPLPLDTPVLPARGLGIGFPAEPERFVGRLQPMLRASQALAPRGPERGVCLVPPDLALLDALEHMLAPVPDTP